MIIGIILEDTNEINFDLITGYTSYPDIPPTNNTDIDSWRSLILV